MAVDIRVFKLTDGPFELIKKLPNYIIMRNKLKAQIFIVDDDHCIRDAIVLHLKNSHRECTCFENADDCLQQLRVQSCNLLITDIRMPGKSGMELLSEVKQTSPWVPVLVMSSYGDIPLSVKAVKAGAVDFIEKPIDWNTFVPLVQSVLEQNDLNNVLKGKPLTKMELVVLRLILQDKSNKEIARILHRSVRTVEVHRSNLMRKLDVDSVVDLVKRAVVMGLDNTISQDT